MKQVLWGGVSPPLPPAYQKACSFWAQQELASLQYYFSPVLPPPPQQDPVVSTRHTWQGRDSSEHRGISSLSLPLRWILGQKAWSRVSGPLGVCGHMWARCSSWKSAGTREKFTILRSSVGERGWGDIFSISGCWGGGVIWVTSPRLHQNSRWATLCLVTIREMAITAAWREVLLGNPWADITEIFLSP